MAEDRTLGLFEGVGIELEYMIVDRETLRVLPVADRILAEEAGTITSDVEFDDITWSNEIVLHVIELKVTEPVRDIGIALPAFERHVNRVNGRLSGVGGRLMPGAMHPFMDPEKEMRLWPHEYNPIYATFNRIFDCRSHGWANLQSLHINLPFADDEEFGRLHAAIRLILPILPGLAASSPVVDGRLTGLMDNRLAVYRTNCAAIPSVTGQVIPEPVFGMQQYQERILQKIYRDLAPHDRDGTIQYEWVNARGAIARFDRNTIEIRLIDMQECPAADLAIVAAVVEALKLMVAETWVDLTSQQEWATEPLADVLASTIQHGDAAAISDTQYLRAFGWGESGGCTAGRLWRHLLDEILRRDASSVGFCRRELDFLVRRGTLARRIQDALAHSGSPESLRRVYRRLCECLAGGTLFCP